MDAWREKLANLVKSLSTKRKLFIRIAILAALPGAIATFAKLYPFNGIGEWTGIGKDSNKYDGYYMLKAYIEVLHDPTYKT